MAENLVVKAIQGVLKPRVLSTASGHIMDTNREKMIIAIMAQQL